MKVNLDNINLEEIPEDVQLVCKIIAPNISEYRFYRDLKEKIYQYKETELTEPIVTYVALLHLRYNLTRRAYSDFRSMYASCFGASRSDVDGEMYDKLSEMLFAPDISEKPISEEIDEESPANEEVPTEVDIIVAPV